MILKLTHQINLMLVNNNWIFCLQNVFYLNFFIIIFFKNTIVQGNKHEMQQDPRSPYKTQEHKFISVHPTIESTTLGYINTIYIPKDKQYNKTQL